LRALLLAGATSRPGKVADANYFDALRSRVQYGARTSWREDAVIETSA
jgi:hypothetical protein